MTKTNLRKFSLEKKVAIVTGGGRGIGHGIAIAMTQAEANVVVAGRNKATLDKAVEEIEAMGGKALAVKTDVSQNKDVSNMVKETIKKFGKIDILVNNAGVFTPTPLLQLTEDVWEETININLKGVFLCSKAVAKEMIKRKKGGKIINISSLNAYRGAKNVVHYCASKGGVNTLTRALAIELAPYNINVNAIAPGLTDTDMTALSDSEVRQKSLELIPLHKIMESNDLGLTVVFLASGAAEMITGVTLIVDGGWTASL